MNAWMFFCQTSNTAPRMRFLSVGSMLWSRMKYRSISWFDYHEIVYIGGFHGSVWSIGWLVVQLVGKLVGWLVGLSVGRLVSWFFGQSDSWLLSWWVVRSVGWLVAWLLACLVGQLAG